MWSFINETLSDVCSSAFWLNDLTWNSPDPDFTACFEKTILTWLPPAFLWLFTPLEIHHLRHRAKFKRIPFNVYNVTKLILIAMLAATALVEFANYLIRADTQNVLAVDFHSSALKSISLTLFLGLTYANIGCGVRSSGILFVFSFLLALCCVPQVRTARNSWHVTISRRSTIDIRNREAVKTFACFLNFPIAVAVFILNCFADSSADNKEESFASRNPWPEYKSSFPSKIFLAWMDRFMWRGYKNAFTDEDLWDLDGEVPTKETTRKFQSKWRLAQNRFENGQTEERQKASIVLPLFETFGPYVMLAFVHRMFYSGLKFVGPLILRLILAFVAGEENEFAWRGSLYLFLLLAVTTLQILFFNSLWRVIYRLGFQMRTALVSTIYKKALRISSGTRRTFAHGEIVNLMAVDTQRVLEFTNNVPLLWACPIEIIFSVYCLWNILGPCVLAGVGLLIFLILLNGWTSARIQKLQTMQMRHKDKRIRLINEILAGIKVVKLYAFEPSFEKQIAQIRSEEIRILKSLGYFQGVSSFTWICAPFLVSFSTFSVFVLSSEHNVLDPQVAFVSLSLFNIMKSSMELLPRAIKTTVQANVAVTRMNNFLNAEELDPNAVTHEERGNSYIIMIEECSRGSPGNFEGAQRAEPIIIEGGTFSWGDQVEPPILRNINLKIKPGNLVAVVGSVGSGKSSLLSAVLGEMTKKSGSVNTTGTLAYVPQQAWIRNATLKDNITFGDGTNTPSYKQILEACALTPDLAVLGDETEIGEKGVNLSGGQKQRISLARAVYSDADIYLLDDPLSAVDVHVGKHIFDKVIGPNGLLKNKTRVFVTHNVAYLSQTDGIIALEKGTISECGTYAELLQKGGNVASFLAAYVKDEDTRTAKCAKGSDETRINQSRGSAAREPEAKAVGHGSTGKEEARANMVAWKVYTHYLKAIGPFMVAVTIITNILCQVFTVTSDYWLSAWSSDKESSASGTNKQYSYMLVYASLGASQALAVITQTIVLYTGTLKAAKYIHNRFLRSVLHWPVETFNRIPSGRILNRFTSDVDVIDNSLPTSMQGLLTYKAIVLSTLFVISYNSPLFLCVLVPLAAVYYIFQRIYATMSKQLKRLESVSQSPLYSHFGDTITGVQSIRAYGLQTKFIKMSEMKVKANLRSAYAGTIMKRWFGLRLDILGLSIVGIAGLLAVLGRHIISPALVGLSISYALEITVNLYWWMRMFTDVETNIVAVERIKEYSEVDEEASWTQAEGDETVPSGWPNRGEIVFRDFHVQYPESTEAVLEGISFRVNGGEKVGIVGRTGAGKSSLTMSLFRIMESVRGTILIDDVDITKVGLHTLRSQLTIIPQDPILFSGTLRMNLDPEGRYSDEEVWRALELVNLKGYISGFGDGLLHEVDAGGDNLSVGQRQLLCLARAVLRKSRVLILDEATASVDYETDDFIQATIRKEFWNATVLTIAHRLHTILDYDRIMVLDKGQIVEFDTPDVLMGSKESIFHNMIVTADLL